MTVAPDDGMGLDVGSVLTPAAVEEFLAASGWRIRRSNPGVYTLWEEPRVEAQVFVPLDPDYDDFSDRFSSALELLMRVYGVTGNRLALEIARTRNDIMFLRPQRYSRDGTIPLGEAQALLRSAQRMVTAAACATALTPRPVFMGRRPSAANEFVNDDLRMGHTLRGSFIITILSRLDVEPALSIDDLQSAVLSQGDRDVYVDRVDASDHPVDEIAFGRRVMSTVATAIQAARDTIVEPGSYSIDDAIDYGASAEVFRSLGDLGNFKDLRGIDLSFKWSPTYQPLQEGIPSSVQISSAVLTSERIPDIVDGLTKRHRTPSDDRVMGQPIRLVRATNSDEGAVVIDGYVGKQRRKVYLQLSGDMYRKAVRAHELKSPILVRGEIKYERRAYRLTQPISLEFVDNIGNGFD